ncbi:hypothetical protein PPL_08082 [Heterostelium album PN500]|uniref:Uncharacterized protein n=1 Tax=Heterostelium pallidum (strain ATCC 26659 / Pp 5 / PN500) TaxID=670386 RepID=D3BIK3_HETP5|nr:hypothetical protein PPL_08082 [Heterostelium album PN500]EFA78627.1 hypothetical protein PPL_08082 [Heterostelium album PN500]|eukprot:XP_020430751.1 hypothetical protein PPL_08082 [Heterostelium album PN500]
MNFLIFLLFLWVIFLGLLISTSAESNNDPPHHHHGHQNNNNFPITSLLSKGEFREA